MRERQKSGPKIVLPIAMGYTGVFFSDMSGDSFIWCKIIIVDEKITFVWVFVTILATAARKTKMAAEFCPEICF